MNSIFPIDYKSTMSLYDTQEAISLTKQTFQKYLSDALCLKRVSAPLFVLKDSGLNDDLNGVERAVDFDIPSANKMGVVIHSLAKWKRMALYNYDFYPGKGLYTDMNAIRRDEQLDNLHSIYVDQWDWEKIINKKERNLKTLKTTVNNIHKCILATLATLKIKYPEIDVTLPENVYFISAQDLLDKYPNLSSKEREYEIVKQKKAVFIIGIGDKLSDGKAHDGRAPDYDDWKLNGDLIYYHKVLDCALEISSMGIRVDGRSLDYQLNVSNHNERRNYKYHQMILDNTLPLTIGGGIGQSRLCMLLMGKAHIGEVQSSLWDEETLTLSKENGVQLL